MAELVQGVHISKRKLLVNGAEFPFHVDVDSISVEPRRDDFTRVHIALVVDGPVVVEPSI